MEDIDDETATPKKKKKKGGFLKLMMFIVLGLVLLGGLGGGALYAMHAGWFGGAAAGGGEAAGPQLVPKSQEKRASSAGDKEGDKHDGKATPLGKGGEKYASNYYPLEKEFTSNLQDSVHFIQVGVAVSTPYDDRVLDNLKTHEIAIRSAILMSLGETSEDEVFTADGKRAIQARLVKAINAVLQEKEGFGGISNVYFTNFIVQ